ncbi:MAG: helix-turn-helix domain-containing protein [Pigmentiphaga sp.]|nr:helix-turn-helix domain-containing protein [Pigmentiphaga sp.]
MKDHRQPEEKEYVGGLEKGLRIIESFGLEGRSMTLSEVAELTGLHRATARRALLTLQQLGYVEQHGRRFQLTARTLRLGHAYIASNPLPRVAQPVLEAISERTRESASLAVLDGLDVVFVARAVSRRSLREGLFMGSRLPAHCSATGRVLLAGLSPEERAQRLLRMPRKALTRHTQTGLPELHALLDRVARQGYATTDEELEEGLRSIAVPVVDANQQLVAAISLVAFTRRDASLEDAVERLLPELHHGRRMLTMML